MRVKTEDKPARISGVRPECVHAINTAKWLCYERGIDFVVTSCTEGKHSPGSRHYMGLAFDMRRHTIPEEWINGFCAELQARLGEEFEVMIEPSHIHVQFNPQRPVNL
jgi:hypothetical protein